jgi:hypothetical protein
MIPTNRPVLGKDLDSIAQQFGMLVADACWLFGMSITKWMQIVRQNPEVPLKDPTLALLVRFLADHPELSVIPKFPSAEEMFTLVNKVQEVDQKRFSVLFGSEASATYRWLKPGSRMSPAVGRLMFYMKMAMLAASPDKRGEMLENWRETVKLEGQARGVEDIFKSGAWKPKAKRPPRKRVAAKKVSQVAT